jgi:arylsulfatase A-like enzyme
VATLKRDGQFDNTVILFMADNGGNAESGPWGRAEGTPLGGPKSNVFAGMNWATLQNTPFAYFKHFTREGGIATPLIVSWPKGIAAKLDGSFVRTPSHLVDIMPTLVDVAKAHYPTAYNGHDILPMDGRSLAPSFTGRTIRRQQPIFWEHEGNRALRDGRWKAIMRFGGAWELYDMSVDRTETHDLAATHPALVRRFATAWQHWAANSDVDPWLESYDPGLSGQRQDWGGGADELARPESREKAD